MTAEVKADSLLFQEKTDSMRFPFAIPPALEEKCRAVDELLRPHHRLAVACSGGVDSTFLAWFVWKVLEKNTVAVFATSPFIARREREAARRTAGEIGLELVEISLDPLALAPVRDNPVDRCYHCKSEVMQRIRHTACALGCTAVLDGSHAGDLRGYRPGRKALEEQRILSPLAGGALEKAEIRELSRLAGLSTWNKPSLSCLATRVPYGTTLSSGLLLQIERAEDYLWDLGCRQVRVRSRGGTARIEVDPEDFPVLMNGMTRESIVAHFRSLGFTHVSLDMAGYRSGSWDENLGK